MVAPIVIAPVPVAVVHDGGCRIIIASRFVDDGRRGRAPSERIEIDIERHARIGRDRGQE